MTIELPYEKGVRIVGGMYESLSIYFLNMAAKYVRKTATLDGHPNIEVLFCDFQAFKNGNAERSA